MMHLMMRLNIFHSMDVIIGEKVWDNWTIM